MSPSKDRGSDRIEDARRAFRDYYGLCFWFCDPNLQIGPSDVAWVVSQLRKYGNRKAWEEADRLCR